MLTNQIITVLLLLASLVLFVMKMRLWLRDRRVRAVWQRGYFVLNKPYGYVIVLARMAWYDYIYGRPDRPTPVRACDRPKDFDYAAHRSQECFKRRFEAPR